MIKRHSRLNRSQPSKKGAKYGITRGRCAGPFAPACQIELVSPYAHSRLNALHVLFKTSRLNLSKVGEHFINPCCFGEDLAAWLRVRLIERKIEVSQPYQEDWGWELPASLGPDSYYLCMSGNADGSSTSDDEGAWRIIVEKKRSLWQRLSGEGRIAPSDEMARRVEEILAGDSTIRDVHREV